MRQIISLLGAMFILLSSCGQGLANHHHFGKHKKYWKSLNKAHKHAGWHHAYGHWLGKRRGHWRHACKQ